eukprot:gb/GEZJ01008676.1/.p1 GENE.gb/GEZJ01008676.1/~~gb/GEZJ01008676.1/.p1  ORF type:complete len:105 (+),score=0.26 gb/GEZJ01008676.1/:93-407(+)
MVGFKRRGNRKGRGLVVESGCGRCKLVLERLSNFCGERSRFDRSNRLISIHGSTRRSLVFLFVWCFNGFVGAMFQVGVLDEMYFPGRAIIWHYPHCASRIHSNG